MPKTWLLAGRGVFELRYGCELNGLALVIPGNILRTGVAGARTRVRSTFVVSLAVGLGDMLEECERWGGMEECGGLQDIEGMVRSRKG